MLMFDARGS